jgi:hypothetical protein
MLHVQHTRLLALITKTINNTFMSKLEELNDIVITLAESNVKMLEIIKKQSDDNLKLIAINQAFFNDYVAVSSELTSVPQSVIIDRVIEASSDDSQSTNLYVVK